MMYKVFDKHGSDVGDVDADNPKDAAITWAEQSEDNGAWSDGYPRDMPVTVQGEDGQQHKFLLSTDFTPTYHATPEATEEDNAADETPASVDD